MKLMDENLRRVKALTRAVLLASLGSCTTTSEAPLPALPNAAVEAVARGAGASPAATGRSGRPSFRRSADPCR